MFSIGEFSKITGLTVKTIRFYHQQGVLVPSRIDAGNGYRYYGPDKVESARVISELRKLDFSLSDIAEILRDYDDEADILDYLESQQRNVRSKMRDYRAISNSLNKIITKEKEARLAMAKSSFEITEKSVETQLMAGLRMKGRYSECGKGFSQIGRKFGRHICGKPFLLCYDNEYKENDADYEVGMPIRSGESKDGIVVRELTGGRCVTLLHEGPYDQLSKSYEKILAYVKERGYEFQSPTREVYLKGPGMIFMGNPRKYLTEIQIMLD